MISALDVREQRAGSRYSQTMSSTVFGQSSRTRRFVESLPCSATRRGSPYYCLTLPPFEQMRNLGETLTTHSSCSFLAMIQERRRHHPNAHDIPVPHHNYAPSLPNSFVHSSFLCRSDMLTVGRALLIALTKSFTCKGGSSNCSVSTCVQFISTAPASPGEQGVSFSTPSTST